MQVLNDILKKDINRVIDGVIKADDSTHIFQEVEEYVLTKEISKYLEKLIDRKGGGILDLGKTYKVF